MCLWRPSPGASAPLSRWRTSLLGRYWRGDRDFSRSLALAFAVDGSAGLVASELVYLHMLWSSDPQIR